MEIKSKTLRKQRAIARPQQHHHNMTKAAL